MMKRFLSLLLTAMMLITSMPVEALAGEPSLLVLNTGKANVINLDDLVEATDKDADEPVNDKRNAPVYVTVDNVSKIIGYVEYKTYWDNWTQYYRANIEKAKRNALFSMLTEGNGWYNAANVGMASSYSYKFSDSIKGTFDNDWEVDGLAKSDRKNLAITFKQPFYNVTLIDSVNELTRKIKVGGGSNYVLNVQPKADTDETFLGWSTDATATTGEKSLTLNLSAAVTYYAIYKEIVKHDVTFADDQVDPALNETQSVVEGEAAVAPAEYVANEKPIVLDADGKKMVFTEWSIPEGASLTNVASAFTATASYELIPSHEVTFYADGVLVDTQMIQTGDSAVEPTKEDGSPLYVQGSDVNGLRFVSWDKTFENITADLRVDAVLVPAKNTVTYFVGEDVVGSEEVEFGEAAKGLTVEDLAAQNAIPVGYEFDKWDKELTNVMGPITTTAVFKPIMVTVKFVDDTRKYNEEFIVPYGSELAPPDGYAVGTNYGGSTVQVFGGWKNGDVTYTDAGIRAALAVVRGDGVTPIIYTATYRKHFIVRFHDEFNSTYVTSAPDIVDTYKVSTYGGTSQLPDSEKYKLYKDIYVGPYEGADPKHKNDVDRPMFTEGGSTFYFSGWNGQHTNITKDTDLYAMYSEYFEYADPQTNKGIQKVKFFVRYDGVLPPSLTAGYDDGLFTEVAWGKADVTGVGAGTNAITGHDNIMARITEQPALKMPKGGRVEWYVFKLQGTTEIKKGNKVVGHIYNYHIDGLYIPPNEFKVYYNTQGGTPLIVDTDSYLANTDAPVDTQIPTRTGYQFLGWATSAEGEPIYGVPGQEDSYTVRIVDKDVTLYAIWKSNKETDSLIYIKKQWHTEDGDVDSYSAWVTVGRKLYTGANDDTYRSPEPKEITGNSSVSFLVAPADKDGRAYIYYGIEKSSNPTSGYNIVVDEKTIHNIKTSNFVVTKKWVYPDGKTPYVGQYKNVEVTLKGKPESGSADPYSQRLTTDNDGKAYFNNVPLYNKLGIKYVFSVEETVVGTDFALVSSNRTPNTNEFVVTNKINQIKGTVKVNKVWADEDNKALMRSVKDANGSMIYVTLYHKSANDTAWTLTRRAGLEPTDKEYTFGVDLYDAHGAPYEFAVREATSTGFAEDNIAPKYYTGAVAGTAAEGFTITNTYTPETIKVQVVKSWADQNNVANRRPSSVSFTITGSDSATNTQSVTINAPTTASNVWTSQTHDMPKYYNNAEIEYTVVETTTMPEGYTTMYSNEGKLVATGTGDNIVYSATVTNSYTPQPLTVTGTKVWVDGGLEHSTHPTITLKAFYGNTEQTFTPTWGTGEDSNKFTFEVPQYLEGQVGVGLSSYTISEAQVPGYLPAVIEKVSENVYKVINIQQLNVTLQKTWVDGGNNTASPRPNVTLRLTNDQNTNVVDFTPTSAKLQESYTLPAYTAGGEKIIYTVTEYVDETSYAEGDNIATSVADTYYKVSYSTATDANTGAITLGVTNTKYAPVPITKTWVDGGSTNRPNITVQLYVGDVAQGNAVELKASDYTSDTWTYSFKDMPVADANNAAITYTVRETKVGTADVTANDTTAGSYKVSYTGLAITNSFEGSFSYSKTWQIGSDETAPAYTVVLQNRVGDTGTWADYQTREGAADGFDTFENIPLYNTSGAALQYRVIETAIGDAAVQNADDGNSGTAEGYIVGYAHSATNSAITNTATTTHTINKVWLDNEETDADTRPNVTFTLNTKVSDQLTPVTGAYVAKNADIATGSYTWNGLPKYDAQGKAITYTVVEAFTDENPGYEQLSSVSGTDGVSTTITNRKLGDLTLTKIWVDRTSSTRPDIDEGLTLELTSTDATQATALETRKPDSTVVASDDTWTIVYENMPMYTADGKAITYTVTEIAPANYMAVDASVEFVDNAASITNVEQASITINKSFVIPEGYSTAYLPNYVEATLTSDQRLNVSTEDSNYSYYTHNSSVENGTAEFTFSDIPVYKKDGNDWELIKYTIEETGVTYRGASEITPAAAGFTVSYSNAVGVTDDRTFTLADPNPITLITNTLDTTTLNITKNWYGESGAALPTDLTIAVSSTDITVANASVVWSANKATTIDANNTATWTGTVSGLPKYKRGTNTEIAYTVKETLPTNSAFKPLTSDGDTVVSPMVDGKYTYQYTLNNVQYVQYGVAKTWVDGSNARATRPTIVGFTLYTGDSVTTGTVDTLTLSETNTWTGSFDAVPAVAVNAGVATPIEYKVEEGIFDVSAPYSYKSESTLEGRTFTFTNTLLFDLKVVKAWELYGIAEGAAEFTPTILLNGEEPERAANGEYFFNDLPVFGTNGTAITYTAAETSIAFDSKDYAVTDGVSADIKGAQDFTFHFKAAQTGAFDVANNFTVTITNSALRTVSGTKTWVDHSNPAANRPANFTLQFSYNKGTTTVTNDDLKITVNTATTATTATQPYSLPNAPAYPDSDYSVTETAMGGVELTSTSPVAFGYKPTVEGLKVTNTYQEQKFTAIKEWANDIASQRPANVTVQLYSKLGTNETRVGEEKTISAVNGTWDDASVEWTNLPMYGGTNGNTPITYYARETQIGGTNVTVGENGTVSALGYTGSHADESDKTTITNTLGGTSFTATKKWVDGVSVATTRPMITLELQYSVNNEAFAAADFVANYNNTTITASESSATWSGLPTHDGSSRPITYRAVETSIGTAAVTNNAAGSAGTATGYIVEYVHGASTTITNTATTTLSGSKVWADGLTHIDNENELTLVIHRDSATGNIVPEANYTLAWNGNDFTVSGLPKYAADGTTLKYYVQETAVNNTVNPAGYSIADYSVSYAPADGNLTEGVATTITNTLLGDLTLTKIWVDRASTTRPDIDEGLTLALTDNANNTITATPTYEDNGDSTWTIVYENLPMYTAGGMPITYTVTEIAPKNYRAVNASVAFVNNAASITNVEQASLSFTKEFVMGTAYGATYVPDHVQVSLESDDPTFVTNVAGYPVSNGVATITYNNLDVYRETANGWVAINYTIAETGVSYDNGVNYTAPTAYGFEVAYLNSSDAVVDTTFTIPDAVADKPAKITNTLPNAEITLVKTWRGLANTFNGSFPDFNVNISKAGDNDTTVPVANNVEVEWASDNPATFAPATSEATWNGKITSLPKYELQGKTPISYIVNEIQPENVGFALASESTTDNTWRGTNVRLIGFNFTKIWRDGSNASYRPESISVQLTQTLNDTTINYGEPKVLTNSNAIGADQWITMFANLPAVDANGNVYRYNVRELSDVNGLIASPIPGYAYQSGAPEPTAGYNGATITNSLIRTITGTKTWLDGNEYQNRVFPTLELYSGEAPNLTQVSIPFGTLTWDAPTPAVDGDNVFTYSIANLDAVDENNVPIVYTVREQPVPGYISNGADNDFVNTLETSLTVTKVWTDEMNRDRMRDTINITLTATNDNSFAAQIGLLSTDNNASITFNNLPKYNSDNEQIVYEVEETNDIDGYTKTRGVVADTDLDYQIELENTHTPRTVDLRIVKTWVDDSNRDGSRPSSLDVTISYYDQNADGTRSTTPTTMDVTLLPDPNAAYGTDAYNIWTSSETLSFYRNAAGAPITFTVTEEETTGYTSNAENRTFVLTPEMYGSETLTAAFTNTHELATETLAGNKIWRDDGRTHNNATEVQLTLLSRYTIGDTDYVDVVVPGNHTVAWTDDAYLYEDLPSYLEGQIGVAVEYYVAEAPVTDYATTYEGNNIINTLTRDVTVTKVWNDGVSAVRYRPYTSALTLQLLATDANGDAITTPAGSVVVADMYANSWSHTFNDVPAYDENGALTFRVNEPTVPGAPRYEATYSADGLTVTNTAYVYVTFLNAAGATIATYRLNIGGSVATIPAAPAIPGSIFTNWYGGTWTNVVEDQYVRPNYEAEADILLPDDAVPLAGGTIQNVGDSID